MLFRPSTFLSFVMFSFVFNSTSEGFAIKEFLMDKIVKPVGSIFTSKENETVEHGNLDGIGRDLIRGTSKAIQSVGKEIKKTFSKVTSGLDCNKTISTGVDDFKSKIRAIYPGTKWCGDGNISDDYHDLGKFSSTDKCCREHDFCPKNIAAGTSDYGLENTGLFTRSDCDCDRKFYNCLKDAKSVVADSIGYTYFTVLGPQCFRQDYPIEDCVEERKGRCEEYSYDHRGEKRYQWYDNPVY